MNVGGIGICDPTKWVLKVSFMMAVSLALFGINSRDDSLDFIFHSLEI